MKQVLLPTGHKALVDDEDFERVSAVSWYALKGHSTTYAYNRRRGGMHRFILSAPPGMVVDHIDHDGLNNTRANLRLCTKQENGRNRKGAAKLRGRTSVYLGVSWDKRRNRWRSVITPSVGKTRTIGSFLEEESAARAYDNAARLVFGEFAALNFPDRGQQ